MVVVDDQADLRLLLTMLLEGAHYCVVPVENGAAALAYLVTSAILPQLILLDLEMPVMNGWEFRQAQRRDPRLARIPVIACTAHSEAYRILALGAAGTVRKPFSSQEVLTLVSEVLDRHA